MVRILKRFALSPRLFSKATEMISGFLSVCTVNDVEIMFFVSRTVKTPGKSRVNLDKAF